MFRKTNSTSTDKRDNTILVDRALRGLTNLRAWEVEFVLDSQMVASLVQTESDLVGGLRVLKQIPSRQKGANKIG